MGDNIRMRKYNSRQTFLLDVNQIVRNSELYNGTYHPKVPSAKSVLTLTAQKMMDLCLQRFAEKEDRLMRLEKAINPLLDDNDLVAFSYILKTVIEDRLKTIDNSYPFHHPVNKKFVKDYYQVITRPMDMETLLKNVKNYKYKIRAEFLDDIDLIYENCRKYNGTDSPMTQTAKLVVDTCRDALNEQDETLTQLEESIARSQQAALDAVEMDSVAGTSFTGNDFESVDSMSLARENVTIAEDTQDSNPPQLDDSYSQHQLHNMSRDEDFVDIEGDDEELSYINRDTSVEKMEEDSLAQDLQITPENS